MVIDINSLGNCKIDTIICIVDNKVVRSKFQLRRIATHQLFLFLFLNKNTTFFPKYVLIKRKILIFVTNS